MLKLCIKFTCLSSGFYSKNTNRVDSLNSKYLFLTFLEAGRSKVNVMGNSVAGERHLPGLQKTSSYCILTCIWSKALVSRLIRTLFFNRLNFYLFFGLHQVLV